MALPHAQPDEVVDVRLLGPALASAQAAAQSPSRPVLPFFERRSAA
jgi:hypothetical protein